MSLAQCQMEVADEATAAGETAARAGIAPILKPRINDFPDWALYMWPIANRYYDNWMEGYERAKNETVSS